MSDVQVLLGMLVRARIPFEYEQGCIILESNCVCIEFDDKGQLVNIRAYE